MKFLMLLTRTRKGESSGRKMVLNSAYHVFERYGEVVEIFFPDENSEGILTKLKVIDIVKNFLRVISDGWSLNECLFFSKNNLSSVKKTLFENDFDFIYVDSIRMMTYLNNYNGKAKIILDYDDLYSKRYRKLARKKGLSESVLGFYNNVFLKKMVRYFRFLIKSILLFEAHRVRQREIYYSEKADFHILISRKEADQLQSLTGKSVYDIPMIVPNYHNSWIKTKKNKRNNFECCFIGNMDYYPNQQSLVYIRDEILPYLEKKGIKVKVNVIGKHTAINKSEFSLSQFHFLGFVPNLSVTASKTDFLLCPIMSGTGIKTKILDGISLGIPIITNRKGIEGLPEEVVKNIMVASRTEDYLYYINTLKNAEVGKALSKKEFASYQKYFSEEVIYKKWDEVLGAVK